MPVIDRVDPGRRRLLAFVAAAPVLGVVFAGCAGDTAGKAGPTTPSDADSHARRSAIRDELALIALHTATAARHPDLAAALAPFTAHHHDHLATVEADGPLPVGADATTAPDAPAVADDPATALAAVRDAEQAAADARVADCVGAVGPRLAAVLASIAASEASHDVALEAA